MRFYRPLQLCHDRLARCKRPRYPREQRQRGRGTHGRPRIGTAADDRRHRHLGRLAEPVPPADSQRQPRSRHLRGAQRRGLHHRGAGGEARRRCPRPRHAPRRAVCRRVRREAPRPLARHRHRAHLAASAGDRLLGALPRQHRPQRALARPAAGIAQDRQAAERGRRPAPGRLGAGHDGAGGGREHLQVHARAQPGPGARRRAAAGVRRTRVPDGRRLRQRRFTGSRSPAPTRG